MTNEALNQARAALDIIASGNTDPDRMVVIAREALAAFPNADAARLPATADEVAPSVKQAEKRDSRRFCVYAEELTTHSVIVEAATEDAAYAEARRWCAANVEGNWDLVDCEEVAD